MTATLTSSQLATAEQIVGYLSPLPTNSAIAFCGNMAQESGFNPTIWGDGNVSYGLCQWQGSRLTNLKSWCASNGLDYTSIQGQCKFVLYEYPTPSGAPQIVSWITDTSNNGQPSRSIATLTADICQYYERAGTPDLDNRIAYANQVATYLAQYAPATPVVMPSSAVTTPVAATPAATVTSTTTGGTSVDSALISALAPIIEAFASGLFKAFISSVSTGSTTTTPTTTTTPATTTTTSATTPTPISIAESDLSSLATSVAGILMPQLSTLLTSVVSDLSKATPTATTTTTTTAKS